MPNADPVPPFRLTLFAPNLYGGGAERTLARLAAHWAAQGRDVTLVTLAAAGADDFPLPPGVRRVGLGLTGDSRGPVAALRNNLRRVRAVRAALREARPAVVVSFIDQANVIALLAARPLGVPVVVSERVNPALHPLGRVWNLLRRRTYPHCTALVVLTHDVAAALRPLVRGRPVLVVPNGVEPAADGPHADGTPGRTLLAVGRLAPQKGFDRLIAAFATIAAKHPTWRVVILGEGPSRDGLERQAAALGVGDRVALPGRVADPAAAYQEADLFVLPSRYEGFPNVLLEALTAGLPAVAFDCPSGPADILRDGVDGRLVPDGDLPALAAALNDLMADDARRRSMGEAAREAAVRFGLPAFFARWDAAVAAAAGDPAHACTAAPASQ